MQQVGTIPIESERLLLRRFDKTDADDMLLYWISDPKVQLQYAEPIYKTKAAVNKLLSKWNEYYKLPHFYRWAITLKNENRCIGQIAFYNVDLENDWAEIEYCISQAYQNNGYVSEALKAVLDFGFRVVSFERIQISHRSKNVASGKVIKNAGMVYEGTFRNACLFDGEYDDRIYYSLIKEEYLY